MVVSINKSCLDPFINNFYVNLLGGCNYFQGDTVSPNLHTDFQNIDNISDRLHLECENRDQMGSSTH